MKIQELSSNNVTFKSGYPTFGTSGHLSHKPNVSEIIGRYFKPTGILNKPTKMDYYA